MVQHCLECGMLTEFIKFFHVHFTENKDNLIIYSTCFCKTFKNLHTLLLYLFSHAPFKSYFLSCFFSNRFSGFHWIWAIWLFLSGVFAIAATFRECTTDTKINNNHTASFNSMSKNMEYTRMTVSVGHNLSILCYCWKRRFQSKTHTTVWGTNTNPLILAVPKYKS